MNFDSRRDIRLRPCSSKIPKRVSRQHSATETRQPVENSTKTFPLMRSATFVKQAATVPSFEHSELKFTQRDPRTVNHVINSADEYFFLFQSAEEKERRFRKIADEFSDWFRKEKENIRRNWHKYFAMGTQKPMTIEDLKKVKYVADNPEEYYFLFETEEEKERRYKKEKEGFQNWYAEEKGKVGLGTSRWSNRKLSEPKLDNERSISLPTTPAKRLPNWNGRPRKLSPINLDKTRLWRNREGSGVTFPYRSQAIEIQSQEANRKLTRPKSSFRRAPTPQLPPLLNAPTMLKKFEKPKEHKKVDNDGSITYKIVWKDHRFRPESDDEECSTQISKISEDEPEIDYVILCKASKMGSTMHRIKDNFERVLFGDDGEKFRTLEPDSDSFGIGKQLSQKQLCHYDKQKEKIRAQLVDTLQKLMNNNRDEN